MARLNVNPTRMELKQLKDRLKTAVRGHKLLKDKSDEMIRKFLFYINENKLLRQSVDAQLHSALRSFNLARAMQTSDEIEEAIMMPMTAVPFKAGTVNLIGLDVPKIEISDAEVNFKLPYSFLSTTSSLDTSMLMLSEVIKKIIKLAEIEKTCTILAKEIEKTRRRVNALEYVMIPNFQETIKYITMKLEENERNNLVRLMKVKEKINK